MAGRPATRTVYRKLRGDDRGVAGAVGAVLLLALILTVAADLARTDVPRWGAEAERSWRDDVDASLRSLATDASRGLGSASPVSATLPAPAEGQQVDLPFIGLLAPQQATAALTFEPSCGAFDATHVRFGGAAVVDLMDASRGCLALAANNVYANAFTDRLEHGAILRLEQGRALVIAGPALHLRVVNATTYDVGLALPSLRGPASTISITEGGARVDLTPRGAAMEAPQGANAASLTWTVETRYPDAWKLYFQRAFDQAGFVSSRVVPPLDVGKVSTSDYSVACLPASCALVGGVGTVLVTVEGPRLDRDDLRLAISHGAFDVAMR